MVFKQCAVNKFYYHFYLNCTLGPTRGHPLPIRTEFETIDGFAVAFVGENAGTDIGIDATGIYTLTGSDVGNYVLIQPTNIEADITKAPLTATADDQSKVFGDANPSLTITYNGFVNGDTVSALDSAPTTNTTAATSSAVGTYSISISGGLDANYVITEVRGTLTITSKALTIKPYWLISR